MGLEQRKYFDPAPGGWSEVCWIPLAMQRHAEANMNLSNHEDFAVRFPSLEFHKVDIASTSLTSSNMPEVQAIIAPPS